MDALLAVRIGKAVAEIALMCFAARGLLALLFMTARPGQGANPVYRLFVKSTQPFVSLAGMLAPRFVHAGHLPVAACAMLAVAWLGLTLGKVELCAKNPAQRGCEALIARRGAQPAVPSVPR